MRQLIIILGFIAFALEVLANPLLLKSVDLNLQDVSRKDVLNEIRKQTGVRFSYSLESLPNRSITFQRDSVTIKLVLDSLFGKNVIYQDAENFIVILENSGERNISKKLRSVDARAISGSVVDKRKGIGLGSVSIYQVGSKFSAVTDYGGEYNIFIPKSKSDVALRFVKKHYIDTVVIVGSDQFVIDQIRLTYDDRAKNLSIQEIKQIEYDNPTGAEYHLIAQTLVPEKQFAFGRNFTKNKINPIQFSLIPAYGSNWLASGTVINRVSISLIGGYSAGIQGVEFGAAYNIVKNDVKGVQIAGFSNVVGDKMIGFQFGGIANNVRGRVQGFQFAGVSNMVFGGLRGVQIASLNNMVLGHAKGLQIAGFDNVATANSTIQVAGFVNVTGGRSNVLQLSGALNGAGEMNGFQIAPLVNATAGQSNGVQLSVLSNLASDSLNGVQITGLINYANNFKGLQIGLINISDTMRGAAIGLINYSRNGFHVFELAGSDFSHVNFSFISGTKTLYNIFRVGARYSPNGYWFSGGAGIGTRISLSEKWSINISAIGSVYTDGSFWELDLMTAKGRLDVEFKPAEHFAIFVGPTYESALIDSRKYKTEVPYGISFMPPVRRGKIEYLRNSDWIGFEAGFRF